MNTNQTPENVRRLWIGNTLDPNDNTIHCIGMDSGWNRWNIAPDHPDRERYEDVLRGASDGGWTDHLPAQ